MGPIPSRLNPLRPRPQAPVTSTTAEGDVWYFLKWFTKSKYALVESFLGQLDHVAEARDREVLKRRFRRATRHAKRVLVVKLVVTMLFFLAVLPASAAAYLSYLDAIPGATRLLGRATTILGGLSVLLIVLRFAIDRHLARVDVYLTFVGMQVAGERGRAERPDGA